MKYFSKINNFSGSNWFAPNVRWNYLNKSLLKDQLYTPIITAFSQYSSDIIFDKNLSHGFSLSDNSITTNKSTISSAGEGPTTKEQTIDDVRDKVREKMKVSRGYVPIPPSRAHLLQFLPVSQEELPARTLKDSFDTAIIPLSVDKKLQDKYMTLMGKVRKGRLLEDMDIFSVWICQKHILYPKHDPKEACPYSMVTASVDVIRFADWACSITDDIRLSGQVEWVGKTSLEVCVWIESKINNVWKLFTKAYFLMAARNSTLDGSTFVNKLEPNGKTEIEIYGKAIKRAKRRTQKKTTSLLQNPPTQEEQKKMHELFMKTLEFKAPTLNRRVLPSNAIWMESTKTSNTIFPHPEDRNFNNTVFGGLLMRISSELSWVIAFNLAKAKPKLRQISDITFKSPVSINSFLRLTGQVAYTQLNYSLIWVHFELLDIITNELVTTNTFNFVYESDHILPEVVPRTYLEAIMWTDARRLFTAMTDADNPTV